MFDNNLTILLPADLVRNRVPRQVLNSPLQTSDASEQASLTRPCTLEADGRDGIGHLPMNEAFAFGREAPPGTDEPKVSRSNGWGFAQPCQALVRACMGLDVANALFGNFHVNWAGTIWFRHWCGEQGLPNPFIGWVAGDNSGDQCVLGSENTHTHLAREWCRALEEKHSDIAKLGNELIATERVDLWDYFYPGRQGSAHALSNDEWERRAVAAWYDRQVGRRTRRHT